MGEILCFDAGHGGTDSGAVGSGKLEKGITLQAVLEAERLAKINGFNVILTRRGDDTVSLSERVAVSNKNNANLFVSFHINATAGATGLETFTSYGCSSTSETLSSLVQTSMVEEFGLKDRGNKKSNFYVIKNTSAPAILTECGFIDNAKDMSVVTPQKYARAVVRGICKLYSKDFKEVEESPTANPNKFYRVCVGSFNEIENAKKQVAELEGKGYKPFIAVYEK